MDNVNKPPTPIDSSKKPYILPNVFYSKRIFVYIIIVITIFSGIYYFFLSKNSQINLSEQTSIKKNVNSINRKSTITITDLTPPDFSKQQLSNLKLDKNKIDTSSVRQLNTSEQGFFISQIYAAEENIKSVYRVKHNSLTANQAISMAKDWGFSEEPKKKDIRNDYEYFLEWGTYSSEEGTSAIKSYGTSGLYDKFDIDLVWDKDAKYGKAYGLGPYHRSTFNWHTSIASITNSATLSKDEAGKIALTFLKSKNLLPEGELKTNVINKDDIIFNSSSVEGGTDSMVFIERTIEGLPVVDGGVSYRPTSTRLQVDLAGNKVVGLKYEEFMTQIDYESFDIFPIITPQEAFQDLLDSKTLAGKVKFNTFDPRYSFDGEVDWTKNSVKDLAIKSVSLAYYRNENITNEPAGNYYQPIYVFLATGTVSGQSFPNGEQKTELTFYVPAVKFSNSQVVLPYSSSTPIPTSIPTSSLGPNTGELYNDIKVRLNEVIK